MEEIKGVEKREKQSREVNAIDGGEKVEDIEKLLTRGNFGEMGWR